MGFQAFIHRFFFFKKTKRWNTTPKKRTGAPRPHATPLRRSSPPIPNSAYGSLESVADSLDSQHVSEHSSIQTDDDDLSLIYLDDSVTSEASTQRMNNLFHHHHHDRHHRPLTLIREQFNISEDTDSAITGRESPESGPDEPPTRLRTNNGTWQYSNHWTSGRNLSVDTQDAILQVPSSPADSLCDFPSPHALWNNMTNNMTTPTRHHHQPTRANPTKILQPSLGANHSDDENSRPRSNGRSGGSSPGSPIPLRRRTPAVVGRRPLTHPDVFESRAPSSPARHARLRLF